MFSDKEKNNNASIFIVDTIGILTKIYAYADIAYVGGGFGAGIHNILEPATFGLPIIIGPKFQKFNEAIDLVSNKGCFVVKDDSDLTRLLQKFNIDNLFKNQASKIAKDYIINNLGATECILSYIKKNSSILQY